MEELQAQAEKNQSIIEKLEKQQQQILAQKQKQKQQWDEQDKV